MGAGQSTRVAAAIRTARSGVWRTARLPRAAVYCTAAGIGTATATATAAAANTNTNTASTGTAATATAAAAKPIGCRRCACGGGAKGAATKPLPATNDPFTYYTAADAPPPASASGSASASGEYVLSVREKREGKTGDLVLPRSAIAVEAENARCEALKLRIIESSPKVQYMLRALNANGCPVDEHFLRCDTCPQLATGHFSRDSDGYCFIQLCSNFNLSDSAVEASITHELIHAFDYCRVKELDHTNCAHVACTEVRASALSGECDMRREWNRGRYGWTNHHRECVRQRATLSVSMNPNCQNPAAAVDAVLDTCLADKEPFGTIP